MCLFIYYSYCSRSKFKTLSESTFLAKEDAKENDELRNEPLTWEKRKNSIERIASAIHNVIKETKKSARGGIRTPVTKKSSPSDAFIN